MTEWCRGPDLYIAVPGRDSRSKSPHDEGGRHTLCSGSVLSLLDQSPENPMAGRLPLPRETKRAVLLAEHDRYAPTGHPIWWK